MWLPSGWVTVTAFTRSLDVCCDMSTPSNSRVRTIASMSSTASVHEPCPAR